MYEFYQPELWCGKMETDGQSSFELYAADGDCFSGAGRRFLSVWTGAFAHLYFRCSSYPVWDGNSFIYDGDLFYVRNYGSFSGSFAGDGMFGSSHAAVSDRYRGNQSGVDLYGISEISFFGYPFHIVSRFLAGYDCAAGGLLLLCEKKSKKQIFGRKKLALNHLKKSFICYYYEMISGRFI